jgi:1-acyl-sn-glycerol-3-phosphate acyltransferase
VLTDGLPSRVERFIYRNFHAGSSFVRQVGEMRSRFPDKPLVFSLYGAGIVEFWVLRYFLKKSFGEKFAPRYATRVWGLFAEPFSLSLRRVASFFGLAKSVSRIRLCSKDLNQGRCIVLNFDTRDRRRAFETPLGEKELAYLQGQHPELIMVPVVFVWQRKRVIEKEVPENISERLWLTLISPLIGIWNIFLGDPYYPNFSRKLALLFLGYRHTTLRAGNPEVFDAEQSPKVIRRKVLMEIQQEKKVVLGPSFRSTRFIAEGIFRDPSLHKTVSALSADTGTLEISLLKKAESYFKEMASNYSYSTIEVSSWFLKRVFNNIFEGLTLREDDFERLRRASKEGPLVFIPTHKSYVDFLMLSHLMHEEQIAPPHIIAGINMNFWPFGALAKRAGAVFMRRSFRGNILYSEIFKRYVTALLAHKINLEFFIEGARSRNGKLAPPKYGILKMITDAYIKGDLQEKVRFVPVSIIYDRVTEDGAHRKELEGGEKVQESFMGLFKALKVLSKNFGKVHVRVGEPIAIEEWAQSEISDSQGSQNLIKLAVQKLAFEICHRINTSSPVTSVGIVCALLLSKSNAQWTRAEFESLLKKLDADLKHDKITLSPELEENFTHACRRAIARLMDDKMVEKFYSGSGGIGYQVPTKQRLSVFYYKNSAIHGLLDFAIAGMCSLKNPHNREIEIEELLELRSFLQFEFFFREKESFGKRILELSRACDCTPYAYILDSYLETLSTGLGSLIEMQDLIMGKKEWQSRLMKKARSLHQAGELSHPESANTQAFTAFIELSLNRRWLQPVKAEGDLLKPDTLSALKSGLSVVNKYRRRIHEWKPLAQIEGQQETVPLKDLR